MATVTPNDQPLKLAEACPERGSQPVATKGRPTGRDGALPDRLHVRADVGHAINEGQNRCTLMNDAGERWFDEGMGWEAKF